MTPSEGSSRVEQLVDEDPAQARSALRTAWHDSNDAALGDLIEALAQRGQPRRELPDGHRCGRRSVTRMQIGPRHAASAVMGRGDATRCWSRGRAPFVTAAWRIAA